MRIQIASTVLAASLVLVPVTAASAATDVPSGLAAVPVTDVVATDDDGEEGLWGLLGLLGLIGLAGLKRRKDSDHDSRAGSTVK